jgi:hypothetical protein
MSKAFELKPLLVAAVLGAVLVGIVFASEENVWSPWVFGAAVGAGVQIGVRVLGVS